MLATAAPPPSPFFFVGVVFRYGFLSENASFADACEQAGVKFVGPPSGAIQKMGDKIASKKIAAEAGVHTIPGFKVR